MIIIEGMDNSGKTTLVRQLMERIPKLQLVASEGPKDREAMLMRCFGGMLNPYSIFDRYHLFSEYVYGPVIRKDNKLDSVWTELAYLTLLNLPVVIYCRPDDDTIAAFDQRDQMEGVKEHTKELLARYDCVMTYFNKLSLMYQMGAVIRYDWREMEPDHILEFMEDYLASRLSLHNTLIEFSTRWQIDTLQEKNA